MNDQEKTLHDYKEVVAESMELFWEVPKEPAMSLVNDLIEYGRNIDHEKHRAEIKEIATTFKKALRTKGKEYLINNLEKITGIAESLNGCAECGGYIGEWELGEALKKAKLI